MTGNLDQHVAKLEAEIELVAARRAEFAASSEAKWKSRKQSGPYGDPGIGDMSSVVEYAFMHRGLVRAWELLTDREWPGFVEPLRMELFPPTE